MSSQIVRAQMERGRERASERDRGTAISGGMRFSSARTVDALIQSAARLPNAVTTQPLQDEDGNFLFLEGYSDPDGPDIGAGE